MLNNYESVVEGSTYTHATPRLQSETEIQTSRKQSKCDVSPRYFVNSLQTKLPPCPSTAPFRHGGEQGNKLGIRPWWPTPRSGRSTPDEGKPITHWMETRGGAHAVYKIVTDPIGNRTAKLKQTLYNRR